MSGLEKLLGSQPAEAPRGLDRTAWRLHMVALQRDAMRQDKALTPSAALRQVSGRLGQDWRSQHPTRDDLLSDFFGVGL